MGQQSLVYAINRMLFYNLANVDLFLLLIFHLPHQGFTVRTSLDLVFLTITNKAELAFLVLLIFPSNSANRNEKRGFR